MDDYDIKWKNHAVETIDVVKRLRDQDAFLDVWLHCDSDGKCLRANKTILAACSAFFERVFVEIRANDIASSPVVVLKDIQSRILRHALDFMYSGEVMVPSHELTDFVHVAEILEIRGMQGVQSSLGEMDSREHGKVPVKGKRRRQPLKTAVTSKKKKAEVDPVREMNDDDPLVNHGVSDQLLEELKAVAEDAEFEDLEDRNVDADDPVPAIMLDAPPQNIPDEISASDPIVRKAGHMWRGKRKDNRGTVFFCEICGHIATKSTHAQDHNRVHTGERPFRCRVCDRSFTQKSHRNKHEVTIHATTGGKSA